MSGSITPSAGGGLPGQAAQEFARVVAQVTQLPAELRNQIMAAAQQTTLANVLAQMPTVKGQVMGQDQSGATLIKTPQGEVAVKLPQPPPQGATVTLALGGTPQAPQAQLQQVQMPAPQGAAPAQPPPPATRIAASATQAQPAIDAKATLVAAPAPGATPAQAVQVGQSVSVRVLAEPPKPATVAAPAPAAVPPTSNFGQTVQARVVAHTAAGQTMLDTPIGKFAVPWPAGVPRPAEGARLTLELALPSAPKIAAGAEPPLKSGAALSRDWPSLKDAIKVLGEHDPGLAKRVLDEGFPRPGPRLATQVLSFLAGERTDARALLGEQIAGALDRAGRTDVLQRLDADLKEMQRQANAPGDWRAAYVPVWDGQNLSQMRLFSRRETKKDAKGRKTERFVVEMDYSEFGAVQVDGLMRKPKLELILRTHTAIPADMRDEIEVVFLEGCTLAGLAGAIWFQSMKKFPVNPVEEIAKRDRGMTA
ncbi:MAG: hypothetical protein ING29_03805 [Azospirillum sp.]|nr:hypothetical protein [Azospirillum sp.]